MLSHAELAGIAGRCYRKPWSGQAALDCEFDLLPRGDEELVVAIPGTHPDDPLDWIRDLRTLPRLFPVVGVCHSGFGSGGTAVAAYVLAAVRGDARLMTVVGHSLGGAMALIVGARLIAAGYRVRIVTFGAPRVAFRLNLALGRLAWPAANSQSIAAPAIRFPRADAAALSPRHARRRTRRSAAGADRQPRDRSFTRPTSQRRRARQPETARRRLPALQAQRISR